MNRDQIQNIVSRVLTLSLCLTVFVFAASAQTKKRARVVKSAPLPSASMETKAGAEKVSIQIKNVSKFIYLLGGVAKGIEDMDKDIKLGKVSRTIADKNTQFKQSVIQSIQNLRAGLVSLEIEFRANPSLRRFLPQIDGISGLSENAESLARAGRFTDSGKSLLIVIEKLADTVTAMP